MANEIVPRSTIALVAKQRQAALEAMDAAAEELRAAWQQTERAAELAKAAAGGSVHFGSRYGRGDDASDHLLNIGWDKDKALAQFKRSLDQNVWTHVLNVARVRDMMDRQALDEVEKAIAGKDVPEPTEENLCATVESLLKDADMIFRRGLANAFSRLDRRFRSHDGFKIGSRIILTHVFDSTFGNFDRSGRLAKTICDVERVFAVLDSERPDPMGLIRAISDSRAGGNDPRQSVCTSDYFRIQGFKNGNAHLWFTRDDLVEKANMVLAEWYGAALGDAEPDAKPDDLFNKSTAVARDLQFFASPKAVVEVLLKGVKLAGARVLEPSAGTGAIAFPAADAGASVTAVEFDHERFVTLQAIAKASGARRITPCRANFLEMTPTEDFDAVLMNPPFHRDHWMDHITHAMKFLRPGGVLRAVVPASAEVNETARHVAFRAWCKPFSDGGWRGPFEDLPDGSFASVGTNVNTCVLRLRK